MSFILGFILFGLIVLFWARDSFCRFILEKAVPQHKRNWKRIIPGYNIYVYNKWVKEIKREI